MREHLTLNADISLAHSFHYVFNLITITHFLTPTAVSLSSAHRSHITKHQKLIMSPLLTNCIPAIPEPFWHGAFPVPSAICKYALHRDRRQVGAGGYEGSEEKLDGLWYKWRKRSGGVTIG